MVAAVSRHVTRGPWKDSEETFRRVVAVDDTGCLDQVGVKRGANLSDRIGAFDWQKKM